MPSDFSDDLCQCPVCQLHARSERQLFKIDRIVDRANCSLLLPYSGPRGPMQDESGELHPIDREAMDDIEGRRPHELDRGTDHV